MDNNHFNKDPTSQEEGIKNISPKEDTTQSIKRHRVLDYIKKNAPITKYKLAKDLGISYTSIYQIIKEFEFCGLVRIKHVIGDNNRTHALIYLDDFMKLENGENEKREE